MLVLLAAAGTANAGTEEDHPLRARVQSLLATEIAPVPSSEDALVTGLAALGEDAIEFLFEAYWRGVGPDSGQGATPRTKDLVLLALERMPDRVVLEQLGELAGGASSLGERLAGVRLLGALGWPDATPTLLGLLAELDPLVARSPCVRREFRVALEKVLVRGDAAWLDLAAELDRLEGAALETALDGLAGTGLPDARRLLLEQLGRGRVDDLGLLERLVAFEDRRPWEAVGDPAPALRRLLHDDEEWRVRRAGVCALARLTGEAAFEDLVHELDDPHPAVRAAAATELRELTGTVVPTSPDAWRAWYADQVDWRDVEGPRLASQLAEGGPDKAIEAIRALACRPLFRENACDALEQGLWNPRPEVAAACATALAEWGAGRSVPVLLEALREPAGPVRQAAWEALRRLTGVDLPLDPARWEEFVHG